MKKKLKFFIGWVRKGLNCPHNESLRLPCPWFCPRAASVLLDSPTIWDFFAAEDSEDEKEDHKNVRQQRQAASKAASKQREMLMDDVGSEEEEQEDDEAQFQESEYRGLPKGTHTGGFLAGALRM